MIDRCAVKLVHGVPLNPSTDWPAYCNWFKDTSPVRARVEELRKNFKALQLSEEERSKLARGAIWIGASVEAAELSWGRPEHINRTITAGKTSEQWVYQGGNYLYVENGKVVAIQGH